MSTEFQANPDEISSTAGTLDNVVQTLNTEAHNGLDGAPIGFSQGVGAVKDFIDGWKTGRSDIAKGVSNVQGALKTCAGNYQKNENTLGTAFEKSAENIASGTTAK